MTSTFKENKRFKMHTNEILNTRVSRQTTDFKSVTTITLT